MCIVKRVQSDLLEIRHRAEEIAEQKLILNVISMSNWKIAEILSKKPKITAKADEETLLLYQRKFIVVNCTFEGYEAQPIMVDLEDINDYKIKIGQLKKSVENDIKGLLENKIKELDIKIINYEHTITECEKLLKLYSKDGQKNE